MTGGQESLLVRLAELGVRGWCVDADGRTTPPVEPALAAAVADAAFACQTAGDATFDATAADLIALPWQSSTIVASLADAPADGRARLAQVVRHFHADLQQAELNAVSTDGFARQLTQSYEEVNLVYRLAKLFTRTAEPATVVQEMCEELRGTLNYGWLAMAFGAGDHVLAPLRQTLLHSGPLPCDESEFVTALPGPAAGPVLTPADHALAARAASEILVETVAHGPVPVGTLLAGNRAGLDPDVSSSEIQLVGAAANFLGLFHQNAFRFAEQRQQFLGTLAALSAAVDAKDPYTRGHSDRVALLAGQLAVALGYSAAEAEAVRVSGLLHDIGKIGVPEAVLRKPSRLTDEEFNEIKRHPDVGHTILKAIPSLGYQLPGVLHHHERWDGRGYPHKLAGEAIPKVARLLALADTFDAMSSNRAYRRGMDRDHVLSELRKSSGTQFDPTLVEPFVTLDFTAFDAMLHAEARAVEAIRLPVDIAMRPAA